MKISNARWNRVLSAIGMVLAFVSCQRAPMDSSRLKFQSQADQTLRRMTERESAVFQSNLSTRQFRANNYYSGGNNLVWGGSVFHSSPTLAASQCVEMARSYPQIAETFEEAMVGLHRCLTRIVNERNMLTRWMYDQGSPEGQWRWGYAMGFPFRAPYSQFSQQYFNPLNQFAQQGYSGNFQEGE